MKIYTKTGDQGITSLLSGKRVIKSDPRIDAYGTVDELNAWIGLLGELDVAVPQKVILKSIQDRLFNIGASLATDKDGVFAPDLKANDIDLLEKQMDSFEQDLEPLRHFILPGGSSEIAFTHLARTVCRRAERLVVALSQEQAVADLIIQYLNRLSDYLFVLSRWFAVKQNVEEVKWSARKNEI